MFFSKRAFNVPSSSSRCSSDNFFFLSASFIEVCKTVYRRNRVKYFGLTLRLTYRRRGGTWRANTIFKFSQTGERKAWAAVRCRRLLEYPFTGPSTDTSRSRDVERRRACRRAGLCRGKYPDLRFDSWALDPSKKDPRAWCPLQSLMP